PSRPTRHRGGWPAERLPGPSEVEVQLGEEEVAVARGVLRHAVVEPYADPRLQVLHRRHLPYDAVALPLVLVDVVVRVVVLVRDLEVMAAAEAPVALEQAHVDVALAGRAVVGDEIRFREPRDRSGAPADVRPANLPVAEVRVVEVVARADAPARQ